jgi:hypothetical protein
MALKDSKRARVMGRSKKLGHCICDPRKSCPCNLLIEKDICSCAGERLPALRSSATSAGGEEPAEWRGPSAPAAALTKLVKNAGCASKIPAAELARIPARLPAVSDVSAGAAPAPESRECFRLALDGLRERGEVVAAGERLRLATHQPQWVGRFAAAREKLLAQCRESGLAVPTVAEWGPRIGLAEPDCRRVLDALAEAGELILLAQGVYVHPESFSRARDQVKEFLAKNGRMNIAQARDLLGASRKYLLPFLEELDRRRVTVRQGDFRVPSH